MAAGSRMELYNEPLKDGAILTVEACSKELFFDTKQRSALSVQLASYVCSMSRAVSRNPVFCPVDACLA